MTNDEPEINRIHNPIDFQAPAKIGYPDIKSLFRLFFVLLLYMIIGGIVVAVLLIVINGPHRVSRLMASFLNLLSYLVTLSFVIRYAIKKSKNQADSSFNFSFNKIATWLIPVVFISTLALVVGLERVGNLIPMPKSVQKFFEAAFSKNIFSIITALIAAPIMEEILCRGIVLKGLLKNYAPYKAILISAIFFAVIHLNPWQALPAFFGGLFLGWVFYRTQSIVPGMIIHFTINATAVFFLFLPQHQKALSSLLGVPYYIVLCVLSALIFGAGCLIIYKKTGQRNIEWIVWFKFGRQSLQAYSSEVKEMEQQGRPFYHEQLSNKIIIRFLRIFLAYCFGFC